MRKQFISLLLLLSLPLAAQQKDLSISLTAPESVVAGNSFEVSLTFNKGDLKDYSRFSQDLPSGFSAENINSPNADFTFTDQRVRIIWLKLPAEKEIEVKYVINVNERLSGKLELEGTFAFVNNGERAYLSLQQPTVVNILPNPDIDQSLVVDIKDFNSIKDPVNIEKQAVGEGGAYAIIVRQTPREEANGIVYVDLLISKPEGTTYLKLEETIPGGYSFESIEGNGAVVTQASSLARFLWMKAPAQSTFMVKYRLIPILEREQEALKITGELSYTEMGETKVAEVKQVVANLEAMNAVQRAELLKTGKVPEGLAQLKVTKPETIPDSKVLHESRAETKATIPAKRIQKSTGSGSVDIAELEAGTGVYFRVQVAAVRNPYFANAVFADYDLLRSAKVERINGWNKYTVGPLATYKEAQALKSRIISETSVNNAFIIAYRDGRRVPVDTVK